MSTTIAKEEGLLAHKVRVLKLHLRDGDLRTVVRKCKNLVIRQPRQLKDATINSWKRSKAIGAVLDASRYPYSFSYADLSRVIKAPVFLADKEITALSKYARKSKSVIVEIGAAFGGSSSVLRGSAGPKTRVFSIDPFIIDSQSNWKASPKECRMSVKRLLGVVTRDELIESWELITKPSYEAVKGWNNEIDMIFIDGDHQYESVKQDFNDWYPHVRKGGFILLHDSRRVKGTPDEEFALGWPGPTKLASELKRGSKVKLVDEVESITVWEKL